jgi:formylglycine-generating enzyme required for sulfatase activity
VRPAFAIGFAWTACAWILSACSTKARELPPFGEALVVVDTDLPVPLVAGRMRVDFFDESWTWYESRDIARPDPRDWPVSFSVYSEDEARDHRVWVRVRIYAEGKVRDYRGERFREWGGPIVDPPPSAGPRLLKNGADVTPPSEPQPLVAVDRLVLLRLMPGVRGRASVTLHGACAGTMAKLGAEAPESCVDTEKERAPVIAERLEGDLSIPTATTQGSWNATPCAPDDPTSKRVCIPGGAFILGSDDILVTPGFDAFPERTVGLRGFFVDRQEVSVGDFRAAVARGFSPARFPKANEGALGDDPTGDACTWSAAPQGHEDYAVSCVTWDTARAFCQFAGGDILTEAQWEYVATSAGRRSKSRFVWGDDAPTCDRAIYGRAPLGGIVGVCQSHGAGPHPLADSANDVTTLGVIGMAGGIAEWVRDGYEPYNGACWGNVPITETLCAEESPLERSIRGGSWASPPPFLRSSARIGEGAAGQLAIQGIRCVYPGN